MRRYGCDWPPPAAGSITGVAGSLTGGQLSSRTGPDAEALDILPYLTGPACAFASATVAAGCTVAGHGLAAAASACAAANVGLYVAVAGTVAVL
jgi:hypothetical protein